MKIRPATPEDAPSLAALSIETWLNTYLRQGIGRDFAEFVLDQFTPAKFIDWLRSPDETLLVSETSDGPDGYIRLTQDRPGPVPGCSDTEISTLYVRPRRHGRGIGKALLQHALEHAANDGVADVWLMTNAENTPAIGFYHRIGARDLGETHFCLGDARYPNRVFSLPTNFRTTDPKAGGSSGR